MRKVSIIFMVVIASFLMSTVAMADDAGGTGPDTVYGTPGDDKLGGNQGPDILIGYGGDDRLWGGKGPDTFFCGPGWDVVHQLKDTGNDTIAPSCEVVKYS